jgi:hypothetical protein
MNMKNASNVLPFTDELEGELSLFSLDGLLPVGQALSVNTECLIISLISTNSMGGNPILLQRLLTEAQMRLLLPLLQSPHYCPHQVLYASLSCSYRGLLAGLFSSKYTATREWQAIVQKANLLLEQAQVQGTWRKELKQLYNVLSELRPKLHPFGLGISVSSAGAAYVLVSIPMSE